MILGNQLDFCSFIWSFGHHLDSCILFQFRDEQYFILKNQLNHYFYSGKFRRVMSILDERATSHWEFE